MVEGAASGSQGKRPMHCCSDSNASAPNGGDTRADGSGAGDSRAGGSGEPVASEGTSEGVDSSFALESFSAASIDAFFEAMLGEGGCHADQLRSEAEFTRLVGTARDAFAVTSVTRDVEAQRRAAHWLAVLSEHGALLGWQVEDGGEEEGEEEGSDAEAEGDEGEGRR